MRITHLKNRINDMHAEMTAEFAGVNRRLIDVEHNLATLATFAMRHVMDDKRHGAA